MLAMQLAIPLGAIRGGGEAQQCLTESARRFVRRGDLIHVTALVSEDGYTYAPFYVWRSAGAMCGFLFDNRLTGGLEPSGRPRVRTWTVLEFQAPAAEDEVALAVREIDAVGCDDSLPRLAKREAERHQAALGLSGLEAHVAMLDPDRWEIARFSLWREGASVVPSDADCVQTYRVARFPAPAPS